jgi:RNA polymerase sigma-70 factor (ECF subfamily)
MKLLGYRQFFLLHDVIGFKHAEIAGMLRCSAGCSKSQLHRARKRLRDLLHGKTWEREAEVVALLEASH